MSKQTVQSKLIKEAAKGNEFPFLIKNPPFYSVKTL